MGNCQAIDAATVIIQHPTGRTEKHYTPLSAAHVMSLHPAHYVALLLTTTTAASRGPNTLRVTRVKLLRPTDTLGLGHVYRLIHAKEVVKGLVAKKIKNYGGSHQLHPFKPPQVGREETERNSRGRGTATSSKPPRSWQPSLHSISESPS